MQHKYKIFPAYILATTHPHKVDHTRKSNGILKLFLLGLTIITESCKSGGTVAFPPSHIPVNEVGVYLK